MIDNIKKIAISGGNGKMGNLLSEHIKSKDLFEVSGIYDPISESKEYKNFKDYKKVEADYLFEFSPSNKINENARTYMIFCDLYGLSCFFDFL